MKAKAIQIQAKYDSKNESEYSWRLELMKRANRIADFRYEPWNIKIGPEGERCYFKPDFFVVNLDGTMEFHEVKGSKRSKATGKVVPYIREDARVKLLAAAAEYPWFGWVIAYKDGHEWCFQRIR